jgi:hypothetical protein
MLRAFLAYYTKSSIVPGAQEIVERGERPLSQKLKAILKNLNL